MFRNGWLKAIFIAVLAIAVVLAGYILGGATAKAETAFARVEVYWQGAYCIDVVMVTGRVDRPCGGHETYTTYVNPGDDTGIDPIMGEASRISCSFYLNGSLEYYDEAYAGDGTDVRCIRNITPYQTPFQNGLFT